MPKNGMLWSTSMKGEQKLLVHLLHDSGMTWVERLTLDPLKDRVTNLSERGDNSGTRGGSMEDWGGGERGCFDLPYV